jgi:hypothetical protein
MSDRTVYAWQYNPTSLDSLAGLIHSPHQRSKHVLMLRVVSRKETQQHSPLSKPSYNELAGVLMEFPSRCKNELLFTLFELPAILLEPVGIVCVE